MEMEITNPQIWQWLMWLNGLEEDEPYNDREFELFLAPRAAQLRLEAMRDSIDGVPLELLDDAKVCRYELWLNLENTSAKVAHQIDLNQTDRAIVRIFDL